MDKQEDFFVQTTLTPEQARVVVSALDLYSRLHIGQFREIGWLFRSNIENVEVVDALLEELRQHCHPGLSPNQSHGIASAKVAEQAKVAWDIQQVIRQVEAYGREPNGGITVSFNDPLFVSDSVPRPTAKNVTILDRLADV
jgi:hypothetical protein